MSEETSGSFTSRLFRKASANLAPAVTVHPQEDREKIESHITDNLANLPSTPTAAPAAAPAEAK